MELLNNPFYILGVNPRDNRKKIMELAEERSLVHDPQACTAARSDLTNPRKRLTAEVSWLPGLEPKRTEEVLALLETAPHDLLAVENLSPMARANLLVAGFSHLPKYTTDIVESWIPTIAQTFDNVDPEKLTLTINEERDISGFSKVSDMLHVESEVQEQRRLYLRLIMSALVQLQTKDMLKSVTTIVEKTTNGGKDNAPILIDEVVDSYQVKVQPFFEKADVKIQSLVDQLRDAVNKDESDDVLAPLVNNIVQIVSRWNIVARPIQLSMRSRGTDHAATHNVARMVRDIAIDMYNEYGKLEFSKQLTEMLQNVFAEVDIIAERAAQDTNTLEDIAKRRLEEKEQWNRDITYEVDIGLIFKKTLRISPDGIEWHGTKMKLEDITRVRWGGIRSQYGLELTIFWGTDKPYDICSVTLSNENIYSTFTSKLWKAVSVRILTKCLEELKSDKKQFITDRNSCISVIRDNGIIFKKDIGGLFKTKYVDVFCSWNDVNVYNKDGCLVIEKKGDSYWAAYFSYKNDDNIHILETILQIAMDKKFSKLSKILNLLQ